ncbi:hypothetical protein ABPG75_001661 [Micractinium tetrahymenae]
MASQHRPAHGLLLVALLALAPRGQAHETLEAVKPAAVTLSATEAQAWLPNAYIQSFSIDGRPLPAPPVAVPAASDCASRCRSEPACSYFRYCELQANCTDGTGGELAYQHCQLLQAECSVQARGVPAETTSGFPVHHAPPGVLSAISVQLARGIAGADFECLESEMPGMCCFTDPLRAVLLCPQLAQCQSMVALLGGLDGCSQTPMYVLKSDVLTESNAFVSSDVFTMLLTGEQSKPESLFLLASEAQVQAPSYDDWAAAAGGAGAGAGGARYKGCVVAQGAIFQGIPTQSISGVTSPEECCRECAKRLAAPNATDRCTAWNHCALEAGCDYDSPDDVTRHLHLRQWECEMRYQENADAAGDGPPFVLAKGPSLPFTAGAPLALCEPDIEGYEHFPGVSPFMYGSYPCQGSLRPQTGECVLEGSPQELADRCSEDPQCKAFVVSTEGLPDASNSSTSGSGATIGVLKTGAPPASLFVAPAGVLYVQQPDSAASGLSAAAIAGIAVGAAAGAAVLAAAAWLLLSRRQRGLRLRQAHAAGDPWEDQEGTAGGGSSSASFMSDPKGSGPRTLPAPDATAADLPSSGSAAFADGGDPAAAAPAAAAAAGPA